MSCWDAFPEISCTLEEGNCYGLISDFACGSWGFARTLAGYGKLMSGRIIISNQEITGKELRLISCLVGELPGDASRCKRSKMVKYIEAAIKKNNYSGYRLDELLDIFEIAKTRMHRPLSGIGCEIWRFSMLAGYLAKKSLYVFPWMNEGNLVWIEKLSHIIHFLQQQGNTILLPTYHLDEVRSNCDAIIDWRLKSNMDG